MKISVGSENPIKIEAVKRAAERFWEDVEVFGANVDSGISDQPTSQEEGIQGAINRAKRSMEATNSKLGVGLEGLVYELKWGMFSTSWVVAIDRNGKTGIGGGGSLMLPEKIAREIRKGKELGPVMDELIGDKNLKQKQGAVGILTNNQIKRVDSFERDVIYALAIFNSSHY